jgi:glycerol-1-phosphate dehydrogenase [NAD(P)+]
MMRSDLRDLLNSVIPCGCGTIHRITTRRAYIGMEAAPQLAESIHALSAPGPGVLVADRRTFEAGGARILKNLAALRRGTETVIIEDAPDGEVHADEETRKALRGRIPKRAAFVLAVGSGTITDLVKAVSLEKDLPCMVFATAASMNGYTSSVASIESKGIKRTIPSALPLAVAGDPDVLSLAPLRMTRAGFGDLLSKPLSNADWKISSLLSGGSVCPTAIEILEGTVEEARKDAEEIRKGAPNSAARLFKSLLLSGFSMTIAGTSAPASGGEHLISHALDMSARFEGRKRSLHGEQVAVGSVIASEIYKKFLENGLPAGVPKKRTRTWLEGRIMKLMPDFPAWLRKEICREGVKKMKRDLAPQIEENWPALIKIIEAASEESAKNRIALEKAGVPLTYKEIGLTRSQIERAVLLAPWIRDRITILDLAESFGLLERWADEIIGGMGTKKPKARGPRK